MSISRKNWSALSSLARQWTVEDEEEVERERRRRVKSSTSTAEPEDDGKDVSTSGRVSGMEKSSEASPGLSSEEQMQVDFVEMLRVRDEKRRIRQVEKLRRQKEEEDDDDAAEEETGAPGGGGRGGERRGGAAVQPQDEEQDSVFKPQPAVKASSYSTTITSNSNTRTSSTSRQPSNGESSGQEPDPKPPSRPARKFVSSVSISLDKSPSVSSCTSPMSPRSPAAPESPQERWSSPCKSPPARSPVQNGHPRETSVNGSSTNESFEQTAKPALIRHSSRTVSFRMIRKKEEESSPLQRSSSVRMASKKFEPTTDQNEEKDNALPFQRNSKLRTSSKSILEKMDRLAQAAQKSEPMRSQDVTQRTLFRLDEVSRKRGIFEKEQQTQHPSGPGVPGQEFKGFSSAMSGRINRWMNKSNQTGPPHSPADLRQVDISSKRSLFENREENSVTKSSPGKY